MNKTELFVSNLYKTMNIYHPYQLCIEHISRKLNLSVFYWDFTSEITLYKGIYKIFINKHINHRRQWQDFGHEMYHYFHDYVVYDHLHESYSKYGESKADYFAYHFCVPTFMLMRIKELTIYDVMELFNVEYDFAYTRLEMYKNKILSKGELA